MRILRESVDNTLYTDVQLTREEAKAILEGYLISEEVELFGRFTNLGISLKLGITDEEDEEDAT